MIMLVLHGLIGIGCWGDAAGVTETKYTIHSASYLQSSSVVPYWQNLIKGQVARGPLKCDLQIPSLCITDERVERKVDWGGC